MPSLIVVDELGDWPNETVGAQVVTAHAYLTSDEFARLRGTRIFNLCRSFRYQRTGYYVSLLATARGHKPVPQVATVVDARIAARLREAGDELQVLVDRSLERVTEPTFELPVYFGRTPLPGFERLAARLFGVLQLPLLSARFGRRGGRGAWELRRAAPLGAHELPAAHRAFVEAEAARYLARGASAPRRKELQPYDLAILVDPEELDPPSNEGALKRFTRAAEAEGMDVEIIGKDDFGRLSEFDALFIRATTQVDHPTYRFARRAEAEGLVVIDDPQSILRCSNKVYLAELMRHHKVPTPRTVVANRATSGRVLAEIGLPAILKEPDSSFSRGVIKAKTPAELEAGLARILERSDLLVAQEFLPSEFDWRVGVLDGQPLYACKYFMAPKHWQIVQYTGKQRSYGKVATLAVADAPKMVIGTALAAANAIGRGFYGVDLKESGAGVCVIEVNDNPSIDSGFEDSVLGDALYRSIMAVFRKRIDARKNRG
ncbi:MAG TPA: RimK family protein [Planctomycetota bacterium]